MSKHFPRTLLALILCFTVSFATISCIKDSNADCPVIPVPPVTPEEPDQPDQPSEPQEPDEPDVPIPPVSSYLIVSDSIVNVYDGALTRIYFVTDQSPIFINEEGFLDATGDSPFAVNDFFHNLAGPRAVNFKYDPNSKRGFIDIASLSNDIGTYVHRITLTAGELTREILITTNITYLADWSAYPYVGTFHRWNQTGERVISAAGSNGPWSARVMTEEGDGDFIVLSRFPSPATKAGILRTSNPGDAEDYQLTRNITSVNGGGRIFFRVGLKGGLSSPDDHRYARIRVDWMNGDTEMVSYVYVRQGESADYLMRPEDVLTGSTTVPPRDLAVKYTVYNITDPNRGGGPNIIDNSPIAGGEGVFTDYPTKAGYFFLWNLTNDPLFKRAFHPSIPGPGIGIIDWNGGFPQTSIAGFWDTANDVCPAGYRHIYDDSNASHSPFFSEVRQSLFLNPLAGSGVDDTSNSLVGFYADGWFDRQEVGVSPGASIPIATVSSGADIAYRGRVYYNPNTNASLFFPFGGGSRASTTGALSGDGSAATYWTATSKDVGDRQAMFMQSAYARMNFHYKNNLSFVRCVKIEE